MAIPLEYIPDEHQACTWRVRILHSQSSHFAFLWFRLLRPSVSATKKDPTRLGAHLATFQPPSRLAPAQLPPSRLATAQPPRARLATAQPPCAFLATAQQPRARLATAQPPSRPPRPIFRTLRLTEGLKQQWPLSASFGFFCSLCFLSCFWFHVSMAQNATTDPSEGTSHLSGIA